MERQAWSSCGMDIVRASISSCDMFLETTRLAIAVTARVPTMTAEGQPDRDVRGPRDGLAAVDERQLVLVHRVQDQLDADEAEQERQPVGQVDQALRAARR